MNKTNEEKAKNMTKGFLTQGLIKKSRLQELLTKAMQWKDEQHKQELIRLYNFVSPYLTPEANNDLKIIIGIC